MSVYTDGVHLVSPSLAELHLFAQSIGLRRAWFQDHQHPHYDLLSHKVWSAALRAGVISTDARSCAAISRDAA